MPIVHFYGRKEVGYILESVGPRVFVGAERFGRAARAAGLPTAAVWEPIWRIDTLAELEHLLDTWPGTLIVASHDRYLVERVCDQVYGLLGDGAITHLPGGIEQYLTLLPEPGDTGTTRIAPQTAKPAKPERDGPSAAEVRAGKKELARLERLVNRLETKEADLHGKLAEHATNYAKVTELDAELAQLQAERAAAEEEWLTLAATLD